MKNNFLYIKLKRCIIIAWLPIILVIFFVLETLFFNNWFNIASGFYTRNCIFVSISLGTVLFFPALFFKKRKTRYLYLSFVSLITTLIFISQFLYYKYSGGFLQASSLSYANQTGELIGTIKTLLSYRLLLFIAPLVLVISSYFIFIHKEQNAFIGVQK